MKAMARILLCNDDGIDSEGLKALYAALAPLGELIVVAPDREQSAAGHSLSLHRPLRINELEHNWFSVDGTPTDCVNLALNGLFKNERPDMLVSGINRGGNLGDDITYSGTVAAAMEATLLGLPAVAVSLAHADGETLDFELAKKVARAAAREVLSRGLEPGVLLNINVPNIPPQKCRGEKVTRQGKRVYEEAVTEKIDPRGREYYWIGGGSLLWKDEPDTDFEAVSNHQVSITPLRLDLTDYDAMKGLEAWRFH